ncbi:hypothetical protein H7698_28785 [Pseudomonas sp. p50]|jgi:hypothetical protein|uniref:hypothetical protein n=1 Tax=Pseudomonas sp. p50(2008) TaxID=2816832 RepID=UPI00188D5052|nr:hypothetical protein [Pseudomonas sp. p50(2008)]MBF4560072.1 hypothetical protein [Pseudomonas sp. p50(2008)]
MTNDVIKKFADRFNNNNQNMGTVLYSTDPIVRKSDVFPHLNEQIEEFYLHIHLENAPTIGGDFFLQIFALNELENAQVGWSGPDDEELAWKQSFVVFADRNGDALVYDSEQKNCPVYGSIQKHSFLVANSFFCFLEALLVGIAVEEEFGGDTREEDLSYKSNFISEVENRISSMGDVVSVQGFMKFFFN